MMDLILTAAWAWMQRTGRRGKQKLSESLTTATLLAYVNMKASLIFGDLAVGAAVPLYTEVLGMNIGSLAVIRALAKAIDFIVSFVIGFASDQTRTPLGRRLPYILLGSLCAPIAMWALAAPPEDLNLNPRIEKIEATGDQSLAPGGLGGFHGRCAAEWYASDPLEAAVGNCSAVHSCVLGYIAGLEMPEPDFMPTVGAAAPPTEPGSGDFPSSSAQSAGSSAMASRSLQLSLWFFGFFVMRHSLGHTVVQIPYDALGQELTSVPAERQRLFASKSVANFVGLLGAYIVQVTVAALLATDLSAQAMLCAGVGACMITISLLWMLFFIRERLPEGEQAANRAPADDESPDFWGKDGEPDTFGLGSSGGKARGGKAGGGKAGGGKPSSAEESISFLATINALKRNQPYMVYLSLRLWLTFGFHLPFFNRLNYLKYVVGFENAALAATASAFLAQISSFVSLPFSMRAINRLGKIRALLVLSGGACVMATVFALIPPATFKAKHLYILQPVVEGVAQVALYTIPEWLLADVIDYDELISGVRREGIFVVLDVNIMQLMDIVGSVVPGLLLASLGYAGNGGCKCGCGVKCPAPYLRWICPGDVGYSCTPALDDANMPLFGPPDRQPPCTFQGPNVTAALQAFFYAVPAVCFALATLFAWRFPITADSHTTIREQLHRRRKGATELYDPLTQKAFHDPAHIAKIGGPIKHAARLFLDAFSESERSQLLKDPDNGLVRLRRKVVVSLSFGVIGIVGVAVLSQTVLRSPSLQAISIFGGALVLMHTVWESLKLMTIDKEGYKLKLLSNEMTFASAGAHGRRMSKKNLSRMMVKELSRGNGESPSVHRPYNRRSDGSEAADDDDEVETRNLLTDNLPSDAADGVSGEASPSRPRRPPAKSKRLSYHERDSILPDDVDDEEKATGRYSLAEKDLDMVRCWLDRARRTLKRRR